MYIQYNTQTTKHTLESTTNTHETPPPLHHAASYEQTTCKKTNNQTSNLSRNKQTSNLLTNKQTRPLTAF